MKKIIFFSGLVLVLIFILIGVFYRPQRRSQEVTIKELISNIAKYDGAEILVRGYFTDMRHKPIPTCLPPSAEQGPEIREDYKVYRPATWGIKDEEGKIIGIVVMDKEGVQIDTMPEYKEGQRIEVEGRVKSALVQDMCEKRISYRSVYLEVQAEDIGVKLRPLPMSLPESR